jgi:hypothetical protein
MNNIGPEQILEMCYQIIATDVRWSAVSALRA